MCVCVCVLQLLMEKRLFVWKKRAESKEEYMESLEQGKIIGDYIIISTK